MRKQPAPPPEVPAFTGQPLPLPEGLVRQRREYALITPLFGGGVVPNQADPVTLIRPTEIRAHLRFWWRACRGGKSQFNRDIKLMKEEEDRIWGSAAVHEEEQQQKDVEEVQEVIHPVQIAVEILSSGRAVSPTTAENIPQYAAFPLLQRDNRRATNADAKVVKDIRFALIITYPIAYRKTKAGVDFQTGKTVYREDVEAALWAWETFGGIGARTRRGFGAIQLQSIDGTLNTDLPPLQGFTMWLRNQLNKHVKEEAFPSEVPHLTKNATFAYISKPHEEHAKQENFWEVLQVWKDLVDHYAKFRQYRINGKSVWPEGKAVATIIEKQQDKDKPGHYDDKFPRAAFGLPINFYDKKWGNEAPPAVLLEADNIKGRLASPLILRPLACQGESAVGLAFLLEGYRVHSDNLVLTRDNEIKGYVKGSLTQQEVKAIEALHNIPDVLKAFIASLNRKSTSNTANQPGKSRHRRNK